MLQNTLLPSDTSRTLSFNQIDLPTFLYVIMIRFHFKGIQLLYSYLIYYVRTSLLPLSIRTGAQINFIPFNL